MFSNLYERYWCPLLKNLCWFIMRKEAPGDLTFSKLWLSPQTLVFIQSLWDKSIPRSEKKNPVAMLWGVQDILALYELCVFHCDHKYPLLELSQVDWKVTLWLLLVKGQLMDELPASNMSFLQRDESEQTRQILGPLLRRICCKLFPPIWHKPR